MSYIKLPMRQDRNRVVYDSPTGGEALIVSFDGQYTTQRQDISNARLFVHAGKMLEGLKHIHHMLIYCPDKEKIAAKIAKDLIDAYEKGEA